MLRIMVCRSAEDAENYHDAALARSDYYAKDVGVWRGWLAERLNLKGEVQRKDFVAMARNRVPGTDLKTKLTPRDNDTRQQRYFDKESGEWKTKEKANRQVGHDVVNSVGKSWSIYMARNPDDHVMRVEVLEQANDDTMRLLESMMESKVRGKGPDGKDRHSDRATGNMIYCRFTHHETRPINGRPDPHIHFHNWIPNATYDPEEDRIKACQMRHVIENAPFLQGYLHHRVAQLSQEKGYALRRGEHGTELACVSAEAIDTFSKRTRQIEAEFRVKRDKLSASARWLAERTGMDYGDALAIEKSALGARNREAKSDAILTKDQQREDWRQQYGAEAWDALTPEIARSGRDIGLLTAKDAMAQAVDHLFARDSVVPVAKLKAELLRLGEGVLSFEEMEQFVATDPRFVRHSWKNGITLREIQDQENRVARYVRDGRGKYEALLKPDQTWTPTVEQLDTAQREAIQLRLHSRDLVVAVTGLPGSVGIDRGTFDSGQLLQPPEGRKFFFARHRGRPPRNQSSAQIARAMRMRYARSPATLTSIRVTFIAPPVLRSRTTARKV